MSSTMKVIRHGSTIKVLEVNNITVGKTYRLTNGWHKGKIVTVTWISMNKNVFVNKQRLHKVEVKLSNGLIVNTDTSNLTVLAKLGSPLSKLSDLKLILLTKTGNKLAVQEFVRRFKKMPKINK
jgi:hypothetical protein